MVLCSDRATQPVVNTGTIYHQDKVAKKKPFLLRVDPATLAALKRWADDDLRSLNGQIEFLLRRALRETGRLKSPPDRRGEREG